MRAYGDRRTTRIWSVEKTSISDVSHAIRSTATEQVQSTAVFSDALRVPCPSLDIRMLYDDPESYGPRRCWTNFSLIH